MKLKEELVQTNALMPINIKDKKFNFLMDIYETALKQIVEQLEQTKENLRKVYSYDVINGISSRIKSPKSIANKMKKKQYRFDYKNLIENINDIAGIRVTCPLKNDIYTIINQIEQMPNIKIIKRKDYIKNPKESGYSGYHLIIETPVKVNKISIPIKVEIQLRTMAMDFWATNEHKIKYKTNKKLSFFDSKKLTVYAKMLNIIEEKISKIRKKQSIY